MLFSVRWAGRAGALLVALGTAGLYAGCGDLIVPPDNTARDSGPGEPNNPLDVDLGGGDADPGDGGLGGGGDARGARLDCTGQDAAFGASADLGCSGLYSDWPKRVVAPGVVPFDPGIHLWSDGAEKTRWVFLPPGQKIDTSNMNEWNFPVGTKFWKEFKLSGRRIETRFYWKRGMNDWVRTTYRWSEDELTAVNFQEGQANVGGTTYGIPPVASCDACHSGRIDKVLGFEAVLLSTPASKFGTTSPAINALVALITNPPPASNAMQVPDDVAASPPGSSRGGLALGWLHVNCGVACHNNSPSSFAGVTGLFMRLEVGAAGVGTYTETSTYKTAVCQPARFATDPPVGSVGWTRIRPKEDYQRSLIPYRDSRRNDPFIQMPPIASQIPDLVGSKWVQDWVTFGAFPTQTTLAGVCPP